MKQELKRLCHEFEGVHTLIFLLLVYSPVILYGLALMVGEKIIDRVVRIL